MKISLSIHKDNMFIFFSIDDIFNAEKIYGETTVGEKLYELYNILKVFNDNGYNPQIIIKGE